MTAFEALKEQIHADPEYAWGWHCNLAMPIVDVGGQQTIADQASALMMRQLFDYDITTHPHWSGTKSAAQEYFELRVAAERAEDEANA